MYMEFVPMMSYTFFIVVKEKELSRMDSVEQNHLPIQCISVTFPQVRNRSKPEE